VQTQDHSDDRRGHHASVRVGVHSLPFVHSDDVVVNNVSCHASCHVPDSVVAVKTDVGVNIAHCRRAYFLL
jgi:hypothetical protein